LVEFYYWRAYLILIVIFGDIFRLQAQTEAGPNGFKRKTLWRFRSPDNLKPKSILRSLKAQARKMRDLREPLFAGVANRISKILETNR
jgi:hypothetical protein